MLTAGDERFGQVRDAVEGEVPELHRALRVMVRLGSWEGTLAPAHAGGVLGVLCGVGVRDHTANVVAYHMDFVLDALVLRDEVVEVAGEYVLGISLEGLAALTSTPIVGCDDMVACVG